MSRLFALLTLVFLLPGCSSGLPLETLVAVQGKVSVKGKALEKGNVLFIPDGTKGNTSTSQPSGSIGPEGSFTLNTSGKAGAPVGWYKVAIIANETGDSTKPPRWLANQKYATDQSGLKAEVVANAAANAYTFDLEP